MIKLLPLLNEDVDIANSISDKINSCMFINMNLFRGTKKTLPNSHINKMKVRTNRHPKDTSVPVDSFIEVYRQTFYPDMPSRRNCLFATTNTASARKYGSVYYLFLPKKAKIWYNKLYDDSMMFTMTINKNVYRSLSYLYSLYSNERRSIKKIFDGKISENFIQFIKTVAYKVGPDMKKEHCDAIYQSYDLKNLKKDISVALELTKLESTPEAVDFRMYCERILEGLEYINRYYIQLQELRVDSSGFVSNIVDADDIELMIQCKYYYLVAKYKFKITPDIVTKKYNVVQLKF